MRFLYKSHNISETGRVSHRGITTSWALSMLLWEYAEKSAFNAHHFKSVRTLQSLLLIAMHSMHTHSVRYRKICIWNAWQVLSHLPPNSHAENLRQIFILRPVSSLIQSKWMQQQTNLSNPTSKQPCSLSLWLKDTDIAEQRSEGGKGSEKKGKNCGQYWTYDPACWLQRSPQQGEPLAPILLSANSLLLVLGSCLIHWNIPLWWGETTNVRALKIHLYNYTLTLQEIRRGDTTPVLPVSNN